MEKRHYKLVQLSGQAMALKKAERKEYMRQSQSIFGGTTMLRKQILKQEALKLWFMKS